MSSALDAPLPPGDDPWAVLRAATRARVALGRAGDALPTARGESPSARTTARSAPLRGSSMPAASCRPRSGRCR